MTTLRTFNNFGRMVPFESTRWHHPPKLIEVMHKGAPILLCAEGSNVYTPTVANDDGIYYVMTIDRMYQYVGMSMFVVKDEYNGHEPIPYEGVEPLAEIFLQYDHEIESMIGSRGLAYSDMTIARCLASYLDEVAW